MISLLGYLKRVDPSENDGTDAATTGNKNDGSPESPPPASSAPASQQWEWKGLWSFNALTEDDLKTTGDLTTTGSARNGKQIQRPRGGTTAKYNHPRPFKYRFDKVQDAGTIKAPSAATLSHDENADTSTANNNSKNDTTNDTVASSPPSDTFGSHGFTDAGLDGSHDCPLGGSWNGYFENVSKRKDRHTARISESFSLFFNATPEADASVTFQAAITNTDSASTTHHTTVTPLPAHHVHVRGMGSNQFGTFELKGSYDPRNHVLQCYRMYIIIPLPSLTTTTGGLKRKGVTVHDPTNNTTDHNPDTPSLTPTRIITRVRSRSMRFDDMEDPSTVTLVGTSSSSSKKYYTRKKRMSWQKKDPADDSADSDDRNGGSTSNASSATADQHHTPVASKGGNKSSHGHNNNTTEHGSSGKPKQTRKRARSQSQSLPDTSSSSATATTTTTTATTITIKSPKNNTTTPSSSSKRSKHAPSLTLPQAGSEKDARWRAAHYIHYQPATDDEPAVHVIYEGELLHQQRHGMGVCLFPNNTIYEGSFRKNREHGRGTLLSGNRSTVIYHGDWERGRMHGRGTLKEDSGAVYTGDFKENARHGVGKYSSCADDTGSVYDGEWRENVPSGRGMFVWPDGSTFVGHWRDGKRHGQGILKGSDGFHYDGMWNCNAMEGRGIAVYPNGQRYEGLWSKGKKEGRGTVRFTNGAVYEGRFKEDRMEGQGTMKMVDNVVIESHKKNDDNGEGDNKDKDWMIPIQFQSDMRHIHQRAGFTQGGE